jgi:hypothetical protein
MCGRDIAARANDGSQVDQTYVPIPLPGYHQPDPLHPNQGFLGMIWGSVIPFTLTSSLQFPVSDSVGVDPQTRLAWLNSAAYTAAFNEVQQLGTKNSNSASRTADETEIGIFFSYDGSPQVGTPHAVRPRRTREYANLTQPELENHDSRIYLGVHWRFDQDQGLRLGRAIGDFVFDNYLLPR